MACTLSRALAGALVCAALAGCAAAPRQVPAVADGREPCLEVFRRIDEATARAGVGDGMAARVPGFPYLRVNRFLASYAGEDMSGARYTDWMSRMIALGSAGHAVELGNLPVDRAEELAHALWDIDVRYVWALPAVAECTRRLARLDAADPARRVELRRAARVPDEYATWQRVAGLYWITRVPFAAGVRRWQEDTRAVFETPLSGLPVRGRLRVHLPPPGRLAHDEIGRLLARAADNPLGVPDPRGADLEALFRAYAPEFVVDVAGPADEAGELGWDAGTPRVVTRRPVVYRRVSHARYAGRALLQLNYAIWFPARPQSSAWDILAGQLDGVLWRVTLAPDGTPWVYDSMHLCGCYHLFFPTERAALRPQPDTLDEPAFVPQRLPRVAPGMRLALRLASGSHYLQRVTLEAGPAQGGIEYIFEDDDALRSLLLPEGGRRSAFRPDGIVPGSERGERWLFWPMGVPEPGAMRQWGRHATAFVGRRHFDDPYLLERHFVMEGGHPK
jgi:hypothetical protein